MKTIIKIFFLFGFVFAIWTNVNAQPSITWQKLYDGPNNNYDSGRDICLTSDGNFIVSGLTYTAGGGSSQRAFALKITPFGDTLWFKVIQDNTITSAYCCAPTNDGGCIIAGDSRTNFAARINGDGSIRWINFYTAQYLINNDIKKAPNGGYIFCGKNTFGTGYITHIDSSGNLKWEEKYSAGFVADLTSVLNAIDGGYIIVGTVLKDKFDTTKVLILKIDTKGKIVWEKKHIVFSLGAAAIAADTLRNGYLIGGTTSATITSTTESSFFTRTDINGNVIYSKAFYTDRNEYFYDIKRINDNRYVFAVRRQDSQNAKAFITDSFGKILYQRSFPNQFFNAFRSVLPIPNGDIMFAGIFEYGHSASENDVYVARTDSMLNSPPLSVFANQYLIPNKFELFQNYPNPFNPKTIIEFYIGRQSFVSLKIFDLIGKEIATLVNEKLNPGIYRYSFDASGLSSGVYYYKLNAGQNTSAKRMVLLK